MELYELAEKYLMSDLTRDCKEFLKRNLNEFNFVIVAIWAEKVNCGEMLEAIADFCVESDAVDMESYSLNSLPRSIMRKTITKMKRILNRKKKKVINKN